MNPSPAEKDVEQAAHADDAHGENARDGVWLSLDEDVGIASSGDDI